MVQTRGQKKQSRKQNRRQRREQTTVEREDEEPSLPTIRDVGIANTLQVDMDSSGIPSTNSGEKTDGPVSCESNVPDDIMKARRQQKSQREVFDELFGELDEALKSQPRDNDTVEELMKVFEQEESDLSVKDEELRMLLLSCEISEEEYDVELKMIKSYKRRATSLLLRAHKTINSNDDSRSSMDPTMKKCHRLPKLELPKFGGEAKDWLPFWSQFETIHNDESLTGVVKFQYLVQCMKEGTPAKQLVSSYPITKENYPLVVECLRSRFGREDLLVEVYVRDLIGLMLDNAASRKTGDFATRFVKLSAQLRALGTLGVTTDKCSSILYPMVESSLPEDVLVAWERVRQSEACEKLTSAGLLEKLMTFLEKEVEGKERIRMARDGFSNSSSHVSEGRGKLKKTEVPTAAGLLNTKSDSDNQKNKDSCVFCGKLHSSESCFSASNMKLEEKRKCVETSGRCFKCLKIGHRAKTCRMSVKCIVCGQKGHWGVMCRSLSHQQEKKNAPDNPDSSSLPSTSMANATMSTEILLMTLVVRVHGSQGHKDVRALLDTGSQKSYVLEETVREVGVPIIGKEEVAHQLFGGTLTQSQIYRKVKLQLSAMDQTFKCDFDASAISRISNSIKGVPNGPWLSELSKQGISIHDTGLDNMKIEVLIGSDIAGRLFTGKKLQLSSGPTALHTKLGWTLCGKILSPEPVTESITISNFCTSFLNMEQVKNLWELDVIGITDPVTNKTREELELAALEHFQSTICREENGRYQVHLPWIEGHAALPTNRGVAEKRLTTATQKLKNDGKLPGYDEVFRGWIEEGIIEKVPPTEENSYGHFLPHRPVYKPESTTPIRPVFDASSKCRGNPSLNDCLEKGPNLLEQIPDILSRFRWSNIGVISDIKKAFLQMSVAAEHRNFMRFLWWEDTTCSRMIQYRHCRVVFGVSSSPFLLGATLKHHLKLWKKKQPEIVDKLGKSFYVDNCVTSVYAPFEAVKLQKISEEIMVDGQFDLRGWEFGPNEKEKTVSVLGLKWNLKEDSLCCDVSSLSNNETVTKRRILSDVNGVYDPIGFLCGFTIVPKVLLQATWKLKIGWDDPLPKEITDKFLKWARQLEKIDSVKIPRKITQNGGINEELSLHVFSDASIHCYATCAFLRSEFEGNIQVQLVAARSRVAPLKTATIPRLELLGCLIGARLGSSIIKMLELSIPVYYWTDSTTALCWIQRDGNWGTFVSNRVTEIRNLTTGAIWNHVPGELNPADLPSRGCTLQCLIERRWWEGATWLRLNKARWPNSNITVNEEEVNAEKKKTVVSSLTIEDNSIMQRLLRTSDYCKILRITALVCRFIQNCRGLSFSKKQGTDFVKTTGSIDSEEAANAELIILKLVQKETFGVDDLKIRNLRPFVDLDGLVRVKTRLVMGNFEDNFKCPVLLPSKHAMVERLIWKHHVDCCHSGVQILQSQLREWYWIINSRRTIRSVLRKCIKCQRIKSKHVEVEAPPFPISRVKITFPFEVTGTDLFGPIFLRGQRKAWVVLFTCANFRAIHLELTTTMSTEGFVKCLRRFVARRGRPNVIYSDNGRNFVGTNNLFSKVDWNEVKEYANVSRIKWIFNVPAAPWWGGWFERLIGIVKKMLIAVLDHARVNQEEMITLLCGVESMVNQRPLTYVSEDVEDLEPLTPAKFLKSECCIIPEADVADSKRMRTQYKHVQSLREELNSRFRKEYLGELKHVGKMKRSIPVKVGDVVLVHDDMKKRLDWPIGVVTETFPGKDSKIRTVQIRTKDGIYMRAVQRIFPLELNEQEPFMK